MSRTTETRELHREVVRLRARIRALETFAETNDKRAEAQESRAKGLEGRAKAEALKELADAIAGRNAALECLDTERKRLAIL
jgi:hypothetical protein